MTSPSDDSLDSLLSDSASPLAAAPVGVHRLLLVLRSAARVRLRRRAVQAAIAGLVVIAAVVGIVLIRAGSGPRQLPPTPPSPLAAKPIAQAPTEQLSPATASTTPNATKAPTACAASLLAPIDITIPTIGVHSCLLQLGLNPDRTVQTPTLKQVGEAGWYKYSASPGTIGPAVILGHIDSAQYGPGVFFKLGTLAAGDPITITRADHSVATFQVTKVAEYPKTSFPTQQIYGNTKDAELRLVTCGGRFDPSTGSYVDNVVAFASLTSVSHA
jgi:sortase (surface protein transpeptidase)